MGSNSGRLGTEGGNGNGSEMNGDGGAATAAGTDSSGGIDGKSGAQQQQGQGQQQKQQPGQRKDSLNGMVGSKSVLDNSPSGFTGSVGVISSKGEESADGLGSGGVKDGSSALNDEGNVKTDLEVVGAGLWSLDMERAVDNGAGNREVLMDAVSKCREEIVNLILVCVEAFYKEKLPFTWNSAPTARIEHGFDIPHNTTLFMTGVSKTLDKLVAEAEEFRKQRADGE
ncbi:hypothetical protein HK102_009810 [Quaeritorhiza haematococci]|nr:hypothetical protein HK102_009810 [Quaeritorhiza haematococci]